MQHTRNLVACCLNLSDGRSKGMVETVANAALKDQQSWSRDTFNGENINPFTDCKSKSSVISVYTDAVFNRANVTIVAPVEYIATSVAQACEQAFSCIDLREHTSPNHPRMGVVDLIPLHPVSPTVSITTCAELCHKICRRLCENVPGFAAFYFGAADHRCKGLVERRKQMKWFANSDNCAPDVGTVTHSRGVSALGAIPYMSVLNISLDTTDIKVGRQVACTVRSSNTATGLKGVQAMAFRKESYVEVACNLDTRDLQTVKKEDEVFYTDFHTLESAVKHHASHHNINTIGATIRGFTPREAYSLGHTALMNGEPLPFQNRNSVFM